MSNTKDSDVGEILFNKPDETAKVIIECDCGSHLLRVESQTEYFEGNRRYSQTIYLAMYGYGNQKDSIWRRIRVAFKYLRSGKMFADQICLSPEEAKTLEDFLHINNKLHQQQEVKK